MKRILSLVVLVAFSGCVLNSETVYTGIGIALLSQTKDKTKRVEAAKYMYAVATGIRTLMGGAAAPSPERLEAVIRGFLPPSGGSAYTELAVNLVATYATAYVKLPPTDPKLQRTLENLAGGLEAAAAPWVH